MVIEDVCAVLPLYAQEDDHQPTSPVLGRSQLTRAAVQIDANVIQADVVQIDTIQDSHSLD